MTKTATDQTDSYYRESLGFEVVAGWTEKGQARIWIHQDCYGDATCLVISPDSAPALLRWIKEARDFLNTDVTVGNGR